MTEAWRYRRRRALGHGAYGTVVLCEDTRLGRPVAIKFLHTQDDQPHVRARFQREAEVTARLQHPNIVPVLDHGEDPKGRPYIVYEYVEGGSLADRLDAETPGPRQASVWGAQLADALHHAHQAGILHRDVKPGNVLLASRDDPRLCDFGLAHDPEDRGRLTRTGQVLGTLSYLAPELYAAGEMTPACDQFALAATLFHVAYGRRFRTIDDHEAALRGEFPEVLPLDPHELEDPHAEALSACLQRALLPNPDERYPDMAAFAAALTLTAQTSPRQALPAPPRTRPTEPAREDRTMAVARLPSGPQDPTPPPPTGVGRQVAAAAALGLAAWLTTLAWPTGSAGPPTPGPTAPPGADPLPPPVLAPTPLDLDLAWLDAGLAPLFSSPERSPPAVIEAAARFLDDAEFLPRLGDLVAAGSEALTRTDPADLSGDSAAGQRLAGLLRVGRAWTIGAAVRVRSIAEARVFSGQAPGRDQAASLQQVQDWIQLEHEVRDRTRPLLRAARPHLDEAPAWYLHAYVEAQAHDPGAMEEAPFDRVLALLQGQADLGATRQVLQSAVLVLHSDSLGVRLTCEAALDLVVAAVERMTRDAARIPKAELVVLVDLFERGLEARTEYCPEDFATRAARGARVRARLANLSTAASILNTSR